MHVNHHCLLVSVMPHKVFECKACEETNERPINSKCKWVKESIDQDTDSISTSENNQMGINKQIQEELKQLNGRTTHVEKNK